MRETAALAPLNSYGWLPATDAIVCPAPLPARAPANRAATASIISTINATPNFVTCMAHLDYRKHGDLYKEASSAPRPRITTYSNSQIPHLSQKYSPSSQHSFW
jgi:hypothetical protein